MDKYTQNLQVDDELLIFHGYKKVPVRFVLTIILIVLTLGIAGLVFYWKPEWMLFCTSKKSSLVTADCVLVQDPYRDSFVEIIKIEKRSLAIKPKHFEEPFDTSLISKQRYFSHKQLKYLWNDEKQIFYQLQLPEIKCSFFHKSEGLTYNESKDRLWVYGENFIRIRLTSIIVLLITQGITPFYVFQWFSILLWSVGSAYYSYSACVLFMSISSLTIQIVQHRKMEKSLKKTVTSVQKCYVKRPDKNAFQECSSVDLAPGDIIMLPPREYTLPCDAVLISGTAIVNEGLLTGESVPITKTSILDSEVQFNEKDHSRNVLYSGTCVIQTRTVNKQHVTAMVIRTGFNTCKGALVRCIMYPASMDFKFTIDSYKYIAGLGVIGIAGMIYSAYVMHSNGFPVNRIIIRMFDFLTIVIPPALPAALTCSIVAAQYRLKKNSVYCLNSKYINVCGSLDTFCFDKTGTLTEDGLDLYCIHCAMDAQFLEPHMITNKHAVCMWPPDDLEHIIIGMATCHSLVVVDGKIQGDQLDEKMFEYTNWELVEVHENDHYLKSPTIIRNKDYKMLNKPEYGVLRQMPFSSKLQRMSVVVTHQSPYLLQQSNEKQARQVLGNFSVYAKGSPEMISSLSIEQSIPSNFEEVLIYYTQQGYRVLALAYKTLHEKIESHQISHVCQCIQNLTREELESDLTFLGLVVMENKLKAETIPTLKKLKQAHIKTIMITGDNMLTALSVAHKCDMIDPSSNVIMASLNFDDDTNMNSDGINFSGDEIHLRKPNLVWCWLDKEDLFNNCNDKPSKLRKMSGESNLESVKLWEDSEVRNYNFAITGKSWKLFCQYYPELIPQLVTRGSIYARFAPDQKQQLVDELKAVGYYVGMCGDGANDCGALKSAHSGISLSEAEASVASPFTSKKPNISCVVRLIREGRCALATSFGIFKLMAGTSMTQFLMTCFFAWYGSFGSGMQYLYQDLFQLTTLLITFCCISSYKMLVPRKPQISLVALTPLLSLIITLSFNLATMVFMFLYTTIQPWYEKEYIQTVIFLNTISHVVTMAIIYTKGPPFQKYFFTNCIFMINLLVLISCNIIMTLLSEGWWAKFMEFRMPSSYSFRSLIIGIGALHFFVCYIVEKYFLNEFVEKKVQPYLSKKLLKTTTKHEIIESELNCSGAWPKVVKMNISQFMKRETALDVHLNKL